jgi:alpha-L-fucosidase
VWRPAEADVSIRKGWFYHPADDGNVKSVDALTELYFSSVGRNAKLLLNVPPTQDGLLHDVDVGRIAEMRDRLAEMFAVDHAAGAPTRRSAGGDLGVIDLPAPRAISMVRLEEPIERGQAVAGFTLLGSSKSSATSRDGDWVVLSRGATIGYTRLDRFAPTIVRSLRLTATLVGDELPQMRIQVF